MSLGERLYELRKGKNISQEEAAEKLNVTRQTISKWETNQSQPDFDKILPLCELYEISTDELLIGTKKEVDQTNLEEKGSQKRKSALVVSISVFLYFIAVIWIVVMEPIFFINDNLLIGVFLFICAIATVFLIYHFMSISKDNKKEEKEKKKYQKIDDIVALIFLCIYLLVSFITMAWHITWLLWIVYAIVIEIIHLVLGIKEGSDDKE